MTMTFLFGLLTMFQFHKGAIKTFYGDIPCRNSSVSIP